MDSAPRKTRSSTGHVACGKTMLKPEALWFPLQFETSFRLTWRYCNALSVAWPSICCWTLYLRCWTYITCHVMLRGTLIMGTRKRSIIGGVPGIYSGHRHIPGAPWWLGLEIVIRGSWIAKSQSWGMLILVGVTPRLNLLILSNSLVMKQVSKWICICL